jgi:hypothetical protein
MTNNFGIPDGEISRIRERDRYCVYCGKEMIFPYDPKRGSDSATIEHLSPDGPFYWHEGMTADNIVICCGACNSSRGAQHLTDWFNSRYCIEKGICAEKVAEPVKEYLARLASR